MSLIFEAILATATREGKTHIAPLGFQRESGFIILSPFHPSRTLENLRATGIAALCHPEDVRVFAGCLTGRREWPITPCETIVCGRLDGVLSHSELIVERVDEDAERPRFFCREVAHINHKPFPGHNRAQAAVIEACILASRLGMLPAYKIKTEMDYLSIAISKTSGSREQEAWKWLKEKMDAYLTTEQKA